MFNRKYLKIIILTLVMVLIAGCSEQSYEDYEAAVEKTENLESGKNSIEIEYKTHFNKEALSVEDFERVSQFSNIKFSGVNVFEDSGNLINFYANIEGGNLGIDLEYYENGEDRYLKIPLLGKYIDVDEFDAEEFTEDIFYGLDDNMVMNISEEDFYTIEKIWSDAVEEENVFIGKNSLIETPDGDVKITEYSIEFSDALLKQLVEETMAVIEMSEYVSIQEMTIEDFIYTAYVDIDGYIIQENFKMAYVLDEVPEVDSGEFKFEVINYDLNNKQEIEIPEINEDMLLDLNQMDDMIKKFEELN